jgi:hypothetical protein
MNNVVPLRAPAPLLRNVLRGAERDAAVAAAAAWYREIGHVDDALGAIANRFNISMTASAEAILIAGRDADG